MTAVAVLAAAIVVTGCGSGTKPEAKPAVVISAAVDKTATGSARVSGVTVLEGDGSGERFVVQNLTGTQDFDSRSSSIKMTSPLPEGDPTRTVLVVEAISIGATAYERIEGLDLPPGKEWVRIRTTDLGVPESAVQSLGSGDPADGLQFLEGVANARERGTEAVRGVPTTKYTVTIDFKKLFDILARGNEELSPGFRDGLDALKKDIDVSRLPGAVWLDPSGKVRRFRLTLPIPGRDLRVSSTTEYYDFGAPVSISAPPAAETVPFSEAADRMREFFATLEPDRGSDPAV